MKGAVASVVGDPALALGGNFTCSKCLPFFFVAAVLLDGD